MFALTLLGLRREEVGELRWSDIDLDAGVLRIRQARVDVNGRDTIVATKTERSARDLPLPQRELAMVKAMWALLDRLNEVPSVKLIPTRPSAPVWTTSP